MPMHNRKRGMMTYLAGDGGNPNEKQVITGTVGNPWGDVDYETLLAALLSGDASATLLFELNGQDISLFMGAGDYIYAVIASVNPVANEYVAANIWWEDDSSVSAAMVGTDTSGVIVDAKDLVKDLESTLTIIWHPLPESGDGDA